MKAVLFFLLASLLTTDATPPQRCNFPPTWTMGADVENYAIDLYATIEVSYDAPNKRFATSGKYKIGEKEERNIITISEKDKYYIIFPATKKCLVLASEPFETWGVPLNANYAYNYAYGMGTSALRINQWEATMTRFNHSITWGLDATSADCVPVIEDVRLAPEYGMTMSNVFYYDAKSSVVADVFTPAEYCAHVATHSRNDFEVMSLEKELSFSYAMKLI